ncbi:MAG: Domain of uncharacterized function [Rhizobium sp.]|nr:Domain of uncharacterized function [Rhizobium sp.]
MAEFIHARQRLAKGDVVIVQCSHQCNVFVMDDENFVSYRKRQKFTFFGGHFTHFPAKVAVPGDGNWNTVLDLGGRSAAIQHTISYFRP